MKVIILLQIMFCAVVYIAGVQTSGNQNVVFPCMTIDTHAWVIFHKVSLYTAL